MVRDRSYDEGMAELFRKEPDFALDLLNDILANASTEELVPVLRQLVIAAGGVDVVAEKARLSADRLAQILTTNEELSLWDMMDALNALGLKLSLRLAS